MLLDVAATVARGQPGAPDRQPPGPATRRRGRPSRRRAMAIRAGPFALPNKAPLPSAERRRHAVRVAGELERRPGPGALPDPDSVVIPDDAAELEADYWALRADLAAARRRAAAAAVSGSPRARVAARVAPMLLGGLILVAFLASLAGMVRPMGTAPTPPGRLAASDAPVGTVGGLLPRGIVEVNGASVSLRDVRPALIVWVPSTGADEALLESLQIQASAYGVPLVLAGPPERERLLTETADTVGPGHVAVLLDPGSVLLDGFGLTPTAGPVLAVVGADGRLHAVLDDPAPGTRLEAMLGRVASGSAPAAS